MAWDMGPSSAVLGHLPESFLCAEGADQLTHHTVFLNGYSALPDVPVTMCIIFYKAMDVAPKHVEGD